MTGLGEEMTRLIFILALLLLPEAGLAEMTAAALKTDLDLVDTEEMAPEDGPHLLLAAGFVQGAAEMGNHFLFCLPATFTNAQLVGVVRNFLHDSPQRRLEPAINLVRDALMTDFPCPSRERGRTQ
jgi:hypothetical protein